MSEWTPELKQQVIDAYLKAEPTGETSTEIIKDLADEFDKSANGIRMILVQAEVYVKKDAATSTKPGTTAKTGDAPKRVSKETSVAALVAALKAAEAPVDDEIISKLTGKAAIYFTDVLKAIAAK